MAQCPVGTCTWTTTPAGVRHCSACFLVPCADPLNHRDCSIAEPLEITAYPPRYDVICHQELGGCGEHYIWSPMEGASLSDIHVTSNAYDEVARRNGHKPRDRGGERAAKLAAILAEMKAKAAARGK